MLLVAVITIAPGQLDEFRAYEHAAAQIMARHGGAIERALVLSESTRELHIVRFPDAAAFAAYRADPELAQLAAVRERCILATEIWPADEGPRY